MIVQVNVKLKYGVNALGVYSLGYIITLRMPNKLFKRKFKLDIISKNRYSGAEFVDKLEYWTDRRNIEMTVIEYVKEYINDNHLGGKVTNKHYEILNKIRKMNKEGINIEIKID